MTSLDPRTDPRLTPARPDLAAKSLEGRVTAARFVDGVEREVIDAQAPLRREPSHEAPLDTEALKGERVTVYETTGEGWCWAQLAIRWLCRLAAGQCAGRARRAADAQSIGLAHPGFPCRQYQAAADRSVVARRATRNHADGRALCGDGKRRLHSGAACVADRRARKRFRVRCGEIPWRSVSLGRQDQLRPRLFRPCAGVAAMPAASSACATATCRNAMPARGSRWIRR